MAFIKGLDFNPKHTEEQVATCVSWLRDNKKHFGYAANFMILAREDQRECMSQPCHREISYEIRSDRSLVATECGWSRRRQAIGKGSKELFQPYFDFLTKTSPFAPYIVFSDIDDGFVVSADIYAPLLQNIMIMTRHFYEVHEDGFKTFNDFVEKGINPDIAYALAFNSSLSTKSLLNSKFQSYYSHRVTHLFNLSAFQNFLTGNPGKATEKDINKPSEHYRTRRDYLGGRSIFWDFDVPSSIYTQEYGLVKDCLKFPAFVSALKEFRHGNEESFYKPPNPFAPKPVGFIPTAADEITNREAVEVLAPFLNQHFSNLWDRT